MNVLVTALSLYFKSRETDYIFSVDGRSYTVSGMQTNEPVPKALQLYLQHEKQTLDKIVVLCTPATLKKEDGLSALDQFKAAIAAFCGDAACPEFHCVPLSEATDSTAIYNVSTEIVNLLNTFDDPTLYIDSTGGFRDTMMFFISMMQLLKEQGIRIADVLYTVFDKDAEPPYPIISRMDAYRVYDLISGMEEMKTYGDPSKLEQYFRDRIISSQARQILSTLQSIYTEMQLCRVEQSNVALLRLSRLIDEYVPDGSAFDTVVDLANKKYGGIRDGLTDDDYIKWYFEHGHIALTLAFFYETLPDILAKNGILFTGDGPREKYIDQYHTLVEQRSWEHRFLNTVFKEHYLPAKVKLQKARREMCCRENEQNDAYASPRTQEILNAIMIIRLAKADRALLRTPPEEVRELLAALEEAGIQGLRTAQDVWNSKSTSTVRNLIGNHKGLMCRLYGIDPAGTAPSHRELAQAIVAAEDGVNILIGDGVDRHILTDLLEKYFYLKAQRNSVLHVGQESAKPKTLSKNIREAIALMESLLSTQA